VRSTNSGVSAFVDPAGRVVSATAVFEQASLVNDVRLGSMGGTLYETLGPWLGWLSLLVSAVIVLRKRSTLQPGKSSV
jgi:apolipoprotein N-acyltransferase